MFQQHRRPTTTWLIFFMTTIAVSFCGLPYSGQASYLRAYETPTETSTASPLSSKTGEASRPRNSQPNVLLIMVDDMGFSDIGCFGGEVITPNLDRLASNGLRFTQFYNCAKCETTRSTLLSGRYYPEVNRAKLENCITIAEGMKLAGYTTLMSGKWHLDNTPEARGFDRYFGHHSGATNYFVGDDTFFLDGEKSTVPKDNFYTTDADTDYAIKFLDEADAVKPFFLYVAYNAPHYPLQAPKEEVDKYRGKYKSGWDKLRETRFAKQKEIGLFDDNIKLTPRPDNVPDWESLTDTERDHEDLMMATYAGMIDRVDQNIGRLIKKVDSKGQLDNTLIIFLDDNGACPFQRSSKKSIDENLDPWNPDSYWCYDHRWAHACNTPFREYKQNQHEGGITSPTIVHWPAGIKQPGTITRQPAHLVDIMATCLDVAGVEYPSEFNEKPVGPPRGLSLLPILDGKTRTQHDAIFFSFYGKNNAIRVGDWKLVNINFGEFELYNLADDRTELNNLALTKPEKLAELKQQWETLSKEIGEKKRSKKQGQRKKKKAGKE